MSYDHDGLEHASLAQARADIAMLVQHGIPRQKISLGMPFYGRTRQAKALAWKQIVARFHPARGIDTPADIRSTAQPRSKAKCGLPNMKNWAGLMIWELGQDLPPCDPNSLLAAAVKPCAVLCQPLLFGLCATGSASGFRRRTLRCVCTGKASGTRKSRRDKSLGRFRPAAESKLLTDVRGPNCDRVAHVSKQCDLPAGNLFHPRSSNGYTKGLLIPASFAAT